jgi:type II secretory pathway pseudopilin PulG
MNRVAPLVLSIVAFHSVKGRSFAERKTTLEDAAIPPRRGATLVEVLMALLIMAVGVTSVFTLFPLSILKAIKANQVTNAKLYEGAIQDTLLTHPQLWTGAPVWSENTVYGQASTVPTIANRWVTPKPDGRMLPDTNQLFRCVAATPGTSGTRVPAFPISPNWSVSSYVGGYQNTAGASTASDGGLTWTPYRHSGYLANPIWSAYVVDPLGWHRVLAPLSQGQFGNITSGDTTSALNMDRIHGQLAAGAAGQIFQLQDSWNVVTETTPVVTSVPSANRIQIDFPQSIDVTQQGQLDRIRIVLTSTLSPRVVSLPVLATSATPVPSYPAVAGYSSIEISGAIPSGFTAATFAATFDQARIEVQAPGRYSWLMAVHSGPRGEFNAQCAIVFNRTFETVDEQGYRAEFCMSEDLDGDGAIDAGEDDMLPNGRLDTNIAKVRWIDDPDTDPPKIKEGGYIFDASFGYWYKIQKIEVDAEVVDDTDSTTGTGFRRTIMTLSDQVQVNSGTVFDDYLVNGTNDCQAVLMPGVVHVFTPETPQ